MKIKTLLIFIIFLICFSFSASAEVREYELVIARERVNYTGKPAMAMTINGSVPGPALRFKEGDLARIHVHNKMDVSTSIHWHGILLPPGMDGVPYISFPPIEPGTTFTYEFKIRQSGTYWYHSHTNLQEQSGVYGAIVIEPLKEMRKYDRDYTVVLSDWTNEDPHGVLQTLKRGSEWFSIEKGGSQSLLGAIRAGKLWDYIKRELQRMPEMDISDVAYDRFFANGSPEASFEADPGEVVRIRVIDGSATTFFFLEFSGGPMKIISADGLDVEPTEKDRFLIGVAETYDILVKVPDKGKYELRATSHDGSACASIWIGEGKKCFAPLVPKPNLYHSMGTLTLGKLLALTPGGTMGMSGAKVKRGEFDSPGMMGMGSMHMMHSKNMGHSSHNMEKRIDPACLRNGKAYGMNFMPMSSDISSSEHLAIDGMDPARPWPPYKDLRSVEDTSFSKDRSVREVRLTLDGDMERYVWLLNNKALSETDYIEIKEGEVVRFTMINRTMMHHPMHLHGHFFRVVNSQGDYSPLKHTVIVPPMSTTVIEFDANEFGDWFFHCHLLYHMKSGMARVMHYEDYEPSKEVAKIRKKLYRENWYFNFEGDGLSNMTEGMAVFSDTRNIFKAEWEIGWQGVENIEFETIYTYSRYINRFFSLFAGADLLGEGEKFVHEARGIFGIGYMLPLNVESKVWVDTEGGARVILEKELHITPRLSIFGEVEYDTHYRWEGKTGLSYMINSNISLVGQWHSEFGWGGGCKIVF